MKSLTREVKIDLWLLSLAAGSADAAGYIGLGRVFTSNMTGNVVLLGIALGRGQLLESVRTICVLLIFAAAVFTGVWMCRQVDEENWTRLACRIVAWEAALLSAFAVLWFFNPNPGAASLVNFSMILLVLLALAMGLQSAAMNLQRAPGVVTTAITGTITSLAANGARLFAPISATSKPLDTVRTSIGFEFLVLCLYGLGAMASGLTMREATRWVGVLPAVATLLVLVRNLARRQRMSG